MLYEVITRKEEDPHMAQGELTAMGAPVAPFGELTKNWGWLLVLGIVFIIFGTIGLGMLFALTMSYNFV